MKKILPLVLLLLSCITVYAQKEDGYTYEEITVDILDDNLHPPQLLRTRKLNKYNKPVYEENYYLCYPTSLTGCDRDSSELQYIVLYEYVKDTILVKRQFAMYPCATCMQKMILLLSLIHTTNRGNW